MRLSLHCTQQPVCAPAERSQDCGPVWPSWREVQLCRPLLCWPGLDGGQCRWREGWRESTGPGSTGPALPVHVRVYVCQSVSE